MITFLTVSTALWLLYYIAVGRIIPALDRLAANLETQEPSIKTAALLLLAWPLLGAAYILGIGIVVDVVYNWTFGSLLYLQWPKEWKETFSVRVCRERKNIVRRYIPYLIKGEDIGGTSYRGFATHGLSGYRRRLSEWIFQKLLKPVDPNHCGGGK